MCFINLPNFILAKCVEDQTDHGCFQCDATTVDGKQKRLNSECNQDCIQDTRLDQCQGINIVIAIEWNIKE